MNVDQSDSQYGLGVDLITSLVHPERGQRILDLGCGDGRHALYLASLVGNDGRVVGVDPDENSVKRARQAATTAGTSNVNFVHGTMAAVMSDGPFDCVFSNFVLHWIQEADLQLTLVQIRQCLKPGGCLFANFGSSRGTFLTALAALVADTIRKTDCSAPNFCLRSSCFWHDQFARVGFSIERWRQISEGYMSYPNISAFFTFLKAYTSGTFDPGLVPKEVMQELLTEHGLDSNGAEYVHSTVLLEIVVKKPCGVGL